MIILRRIAITCLVLKVKFEITKSAKFEKKIRKSDKKLIQFQNFMAFFNCLGLEIRLSTSLTWTNYFFVYINIVKKRKYDWMLQSFPRIVIKEVEEDVKYKAAIFKRMWVIEYDILTLTLFKKPFFIVVKNIFKNTNL